MKIVIDVSVFRLCVSFRDSADCPSVVARHSMFYDWPTDIRVLRRSARMWSSSRQKGHGSQGSLHATALRIDLPRRNPT